MKEGDMTPNINYRRKIDIELIERITTLETKVDFIINDMATVKSDLKTSNNDLKIFIGHEINIQKEIAANALASAREAVNKAEGLTNLKFEVANNVKADAEKKYEELKTYVDKQTGGKTGVKDFRDYISWILIILGFVITYFVLGGKA